VSRKITLPGETTPNHYSGGAAGPKPTSIGQARRHPRVCAAVRLIRLDLVNAVAPGVRETAHAGQRELRASFQLQTQCSEMRGAVPSAFAE